MKFVEGVNSTPSVSHLVLKEASGEWEDPVNNLCELEKD
jgi:hypothetical protein